MMYRGYYRLKMGKEECAKLEELLRERWEAKEVVFKEVCPGRWKLSFLVESNRMVFALEKIVESYGGKVYSKWIKKEE